MGGRGVTVMASVRVGSYCIMTSVGGRHLWGVGELLYNDICGG